MIKNFDAKYVMFPVSFLQEYHGDQKRERTIDKMIFYGIMRFAETMELSLDGLLQEVIFRYYRNNNDEPLYCYLQELCEMGKVSFSEPHSGFYGDGFNPSGELESILEQYNSDLKLQQLIGDIESEIRFDKSCKFYDYALPVVDSETGWAKFKVMEAYSIGQPMVSINLNKLLEFRYNDMDYYDIIQFACYLGVKSIVGQKDVCHTNKSHIISRMIGFSSVREYEQSNNATLKTLYNHYSQRYHYRKLMLRLQTDWGVIYHAQGGIRGCYISCDNNMSLLRVIQHAERKKRGTKNKALSDKKKAAYLLAKGKK